MDIKTVGSMLWSKIEHLIQPQVGRSDLAKMVGYIENAGAPASVVPDFIGQKLFDTTNKDFYIAFGVAAGEFSLMGSDTLSAAELAYLDGASTTQTANKVIVNDANVNQGIAKVTQLHLGTSGSETQVTATGAQLNRTAVTTAGTIEASKVVTADANKDVTGGRQHTLGANGVGGAVGILHLKDGQNPGYQIDLQTDSQTANLAVHVPDPGAIVDAYVALSTAALTAAEVDVLDGASSTNSVASKAAILDSTGILALSNNKLAVEAGAGITGGIGTVYKSSVAKLGGIISTRILIDLTGLSSSTTDLDIIGQGAVAAHLGQITAVRNGTILTGKITCLEAPVGGVTDIDLYSATEATGVFDDGIAALTETALLTSGAAWTLDRSVSFSAMPAADQHLYLTGGAAGTAAAYTAGKFLIELEGY